MPNTSSSRFPPLKKAEKAHKSPRSLAKGGDSAKSALNDLCFRNKLRPPQALTNRAAFILARLSRVKQKI